MSNIRHRVNFAMHSAQRMGGIKVAKKGDEKPEYSAIIVRFDTVNSMSLYDYMLKTLLVVEACGGKVEVSNRYLREYRMGKGVTIYFCFYDEDFELWVKVYEDKRKVDSQIIIRNGEILVETKHLLRIMSTYL